MQCVAHGWKFLFFSLFFKLNFHLPVQFIQNIHRNYGKTMLGGPSLGKQSKHLPLLCTVTLQEVPPHDSGGEVL